jgi:hypothetical protein
MSTYHRYHIETSPAPDHVSHPPRFRVQVRKPRLVGLVLKEAVEFRGNLAVALSRPCVYGVFGSVFGGLMPREHLCVGCLRCTIQYPDIVQVHPNPDRRSLGDSYLTADQVDTILYESRTGRVPVRGAGYRGLFGGPGWDGIWTDMSEIVRPTRDGIHGREFISTLVEIGEKPSRLTLDERGAPVGPAPRVLSMQLPFLFDLPPRSVRSESLLRALAEAARRIDSLAMVPASTAARGISGPHVVPIVGQKDGDRPARLDWTPRLVMLEGYDADRFEELRRRFPGSLHGVRVPAETDVLGLVRAGVRIFHLTADYHADAAGRFLGDRILQSHRALVTAGLREEVTLIGSGGITAAEHVPKAMICGLDAVGIETAVCAALQARFLGECRRREEARIVLHGIDPTWAVQRVVNLAGAWRDQLLEVMGAMGIREARRLRGETGRCMFQRDVEREAFAGIDGYEG